MDAQTSYANHKKPSSRSQVLPMEIGRGLNREIRSKFAPSGNLITQYSLHRFQDVFAIKRAPDYSPTLNISSLSFRSLHIACSLVAALRPIFTNRKAHLKA